LTIFFAFVRKEFWHVLRDSRSLVILIGLPVMMMLIFGFALSNEVKNTTVAVLDYSGDDVSTQLIQKLNESHYLDINHHLRRYDDLELLFRENKVRLGIIFPAGMQKALLGEGETTVQIIGNGVDPNTANTAIQYASAIIADFQKELWGERDLPYQISTEYRMLYNPQLQSSYTFVPGVMALLFMLLGTMMTAVSIVREKELGTMEILLVSPMRPLVIILSKAVPYLVLCFIDVLIVLLLANTLLGMPIRGSLALLLSMCILYIFTSLSLGLMISSLVKTQQVALFILLVGFQMPALVFGGFMFPIENMPSPLQFISLFVPTRWFYEILKNVMVKGLDFAFIIQPVLILSGMTLVYLVVALKKFKVRLE
jgi:ABC-2 type transport system permease protein